MNVVLANVATGGLPTVDNPEDIDKWPSAAVTEQAFASIIEIIHRGYQGVRIDYGRLSGGRTIINYLTKEATPEGVIVGAVMDFARAGSALPKAEVISVLERIYREQGLTLPTKTNVHRSPGSWLEGAS